MSESYTRSGSRYSFLNRGSIAIYVELDAYRDFGILLTPSVRGCYDVSNGFRFASGINTYLFSQLLWCSAVNSAANLIPPHIGIGNEPLIHRCRSGQSQHNGAKWAQLVVKHSSFSDVLGLESDLETAAAHSKSHSVHVDEVIRGCPVSHIVVLGPVVLVEVYSGILPGFRCVLIVKDGDVDLNLAASS